jgi:hypothetical protein
LGAPLSSHEPRQIWSFFTTGLPLGVHRCREAGRTLAWDDDNRLYLLDRAGGCVVQVQLPAPIAAAAAADDGSAYAVSSRNGELWWLKEGLTTSWQRSLDHSALALAVDSFGHYGLSADRTGSLRVFDHLGATVWQCQTVKPLLHVSFVPEARLLVGAAEFGLVACYDFKGNCVWRDAPVVHVACLALPSSGRPICLACYSEGVRAYEIDGKPHPLPSPPCRLVSISADGRRLALADTTIIQVADMSGAIISAHELNKTAVALAIDSLGHNVIVALADRRIVCLDIDPA